MPRETATAERMDDPAASPTDDLAAMVAHDLRSAIGALSAHVELLLHRWERLDEAGRRGYLEAIGRSAERAAAVVDRLDHGATGGPRPPG